MSTIGWLFLLLPVTLFGYGYVIYPIILIVANRVRTPTAAQPEADPPVWPFITILLIVHDEAAVIAQTLDALLAIDYPVDRRQILVVSDCSTDATNDLVRDRADMVAFVELSTRVGKSGAVAAALPFLRGEIVISVDATTVLHPQAVKHLIRTLEDRSVGVASGCDLSVSSASQDPMAGESLYVRYEMWVRRLETHSSSLVGASGCLFAVRRELLQQVDLTRLSLDFAAVLLAHEAGLRSKSVDPATCYVPRTIDMRVEFNRKLRTMSGGLITLWLKRGLLNPLHHGAFSFMLLSHKLCRWLVVLTVPLGVIGLGILAATYSIAGWLLCAVLIVYGLGVVAFAGPRGRRLPPALSLPAYITLCTFAGVLAWWRAVRWPDNAIWEPTRRPRLSLATAQSEMTKLLTTRHSRHCRLPTVSRVRETRST